MFHDISLYSSYMCCVRLIEVLTVCHLVYLARTALQFSLHSPKLHFSTSYKTSRVSKTFLSYWHFNIYYSARLFGKKKSHTGLIYTGGCSPSPVLLHPKDLSEFNCKISSCSHSKDSFVFIKSIVFHFFLWTRSENKHRIKKKIKCSDIS